jgi:beta-phosphoglucomutase-like phosphatase (HAD superfamily)
MRIEPVFLFDLDGTLVDSVYQHVLAWKAALDSENIELSVWRIHRKIGMSGGLFTNQLLRETGFEIDPARIERLRQRTRPTTTRFRATSGPCPARASCSPSSPTRKSPGRSRPAGGWRRRR